MNVFFAARPNIGGYTINPLSAGRLAILQERGNPLAAEDGKDTNTAPAQAEIWAIGEVFFVCVSSGQELSQWSLESQEDWQARVRGFVIDLDSALIVEFSALLQREIQALTDSQVVAIEAPGKRRGRPRK